MIILAIKKYFMVQMQQDLHEHPGPADRRERVVRHQHRHQRVLGHLGLLQVLYCTVLYCNV